MHADHIIVGQGLCGTLLSRLLVREGKSVLVIDDRDPAAAGRNAGGIINPVTGKRLVRSWMIDELLPFARTTYRAIEQELRIPLLTELSILDMYHTTDERTLFEERQQSDNEYLHTYTNDKWQQYFSYRYGIGEIAPCMLVDLRMLMDAWRVKLQNTNAVLEERFDIAALKVNEDGVSYKGISAGSIIFCDGAACADNPYFDRLPWSKDKGEVLTVSIPGLPREHIYKQGISIVPWRDGLFWVGASHDWKYTTLSPTPAFRKSVTDHLDNWLRLPYEVVDHIAALRPANFDRKPFIGMHPIHERIGIFNGMGGKGCSMAPYFAQHFCDHLVGHTSIMPDVDVRRYNKILSK
ncbi:FAD-binding oxidoreductase [Nemorincola caseinilytica]|uniref:FAD-binding oxidoreductase n=1 Tax=Nemorincola caseinilytica TaxID=2054315 RepID=A0ABP8N1R6_9BACT